MNSGNQSHSYDEADLVARAAHGDLDAFNQLVLHYQQIAYNYANALLSDPDQAEDATQESIIKAFQGLSAFRGGSFRSWLLRIVTSSAYDLLRRARRYPTQPLFPEDEHGDEVESAPWLADPSSSVQETLEQKELSKDIYRVLDELPDVYRNVLTLIDLHEVNYAQAAEALRIPIGTLKSRLARARLQMKNRLEKVRLRQTTMSQMNSVAV